MKLLIGLGLFVSAVGKSDTFFPDFHCTSGNYNEVNYSVYRRLDHAGVHDKVTLIKSVAVPGFPNIARVVLYSDVPATTNIWNGQTYVNFETPMGSRVLLYTPGGASVLSDGKQKIVDLSCREAFSQDVVPDKD